MAPFRRPMMPPVVGMKVSSSVPDPLGGLPFPTHRVAPVLRPPRGMSNVLPLHENARMVAPEAALHDCRDATRWRPLPLRCAGLPVSGARLRRRNRDADVIIGEN